MDTKFVKVFRQPGVTKEVAVDPSMTVGETLLAAGIEVNSNEMVKGDGEVISVASDVNGFTKISVVPNIKGA
jgi:hypothetical protein